MAAGKQDTHLPNTLPFSLWGHCITWALLLCDPLPPQLKILAGNQVLASITQLEPPPLPILGEIVLNPRFSQMIPFTMVGWDILDQPYKWRHLHWQEGNSSQLIRTQNLSPDPDSLFRLALHSFRHCSNESNVGQLEVSAMPTVLQYSRPHRAPGKTVTAHPILQRSPTHL